MPAPMSLAEMIALADSAQRAAEAARADALREVRELLGAEVAVNAYGALELTAEQAETLYSKLPIVEQQLGLDSLAGFPVWVVDEPRVSSQAGLGAIAGGRGL